MAAEREQRSSRPPLDLLREQFVEDFSTTSQLVEISNGAIEAAPLDQLKSWRHQSKTLMYHMSKQVSTMYRRMKEVGSVEKAKDVKVEYSMLRSEYLLNKILVEKRIEDLGETLSDAGDSVATDVSEWVNDLDSDDKVDNNLNDEYEDTN